MLLVLISIVKSTLTKHFKFHCSEQLILKKISTSINTNWTPLNNGHCSNVPPQRNRMLCLNHSLCSQPLKNGLDPLSCLRFIFRDRINLRIILSSKEINLLGTNLKMKFFFLHFSLSKLWKLTKLKKKSMLRLQLKRLMDQLKRISGIIWLKLLW